MQEKSNAIVFIGCGYPIGGVLFLAYMGVELYKLQRDLGADLFFAAINQEGNKGFWNVVQGTIPENRIIKASQFDGLAYKVVELSKKYSRVLVHTGGGWGQTKCILKAKANLKRADANKISLIATTHSYQNDNFRRIPMSIFQCILYLLFYDKIIFQCKNAAERFVGASLLFHFGKGAIVPLGVEEKPTQSEHVPEVLAGVLNDETLFKMVYLAGFRPGKKHVWLVKNLAPVLKAHSEVRLLLCGEGEKRVMEKVREVIQREGLEGQVLMPGQVPREEVPTVLGKVQCAVVPSRAETFGHNFLEPMFFGLPVIGTQCGIGKELIRDGETGFGFSLWRPQELRRAVETCLGDRALVKRMGENARRAVATTYRHSDVVKKLMAVYKDVLNAY